MDIKDRDGQTLCVIIVTHNRKEDLLACLKALQGQSYPFNALYIIDNNSSDGTFSFLQENNFLPSTGTRFAVDNDELSSLIHFGNNDASFFLYYHRTPTNTGGAGGFYEGLLRTYKKGFQWFWLMDDDTIPSKDSLKHLFDPVISNLFSHKDIGFFCSHIIWKDGTPHLMNIPIVSAFANRKPFTLFLNAISPFLLVNSCSFVSILINREAIDKCGFPIKEFFIWGDDVEYTTRITKAGFLGLFNPKSVALHNTKNNYCVEIDQLDKNNIWKIFYDTRNKVYMIKTNAGYFNRYLFLLLFFLKNLSLAIRNKYLLRSTWLFLKGFFAGVFFCPKICYPRQGERNEELDSFEYIPK